LHFRTAVAISRTLTAFGARHEFEEIMLANLGLGREDPCALAADQNAVPQADAGHGHAAGGTSGIDEDSAVHFLILDIDPIAADADLRAKIGAAIEAIRERAVDIGDRRDTIADMSGHGPVRVNLGQDAVQLCGRLGGNLNAGMTGVVLLFAKLKMLDMVSAAAAENGIEHLGQQQTVDNVPGHFDMFDDFGFDGGHGEPRIRRGVVILRRPDRREPQPRVDSRVGLVRRPDCVKMWINGGYSSAG
jgi:hypothetical protein